MNEDTKYPETFEQFMWDNLIGYVPDIVKHGCAGGFPHLTYYTDTVALYDKYSDEIWSALYEDADAFGHDNPLQLIATFGGAGNVDGDTTFKNLLVWYYAERTAYQITEG